MKKTKKQHSTITIAITVACLAACNAGSAQVDQNYPNTPTYNYSPSFAPAPPVAAQTNSDVRFEADQLDQMLGPIALYPDPLLTEVLAACTYPQDVAALGQKLQYDSTLSQDELNAQSWDVSVKALAPYPTVVQMMCSQMDWTEALGAAMVNQPQDVMASVQRLRTQAKAAATLTTTPQQQVVEDNGSIEILPAQPETIYVPTYDPLVVYTSQPPGNWITFGIGCPINPFFDMNFDWRNHFIQRGVRWGRDWRRPEFVGNAHWEHDRSRAIPAPRNPFVPPRGVQDKRGWTGGSRTPGALNPGLTPRVQQQPKPITPQRVTPAPNQRAVQGLPQVPKRAVPLPTPNTPLRPTEPRPGPIAPARPAIPAVPPTRIPEPAPARPVAPAPRVVQPAPIQRPVTGLPARPARAPEPPRAAPAPQPHAAPSPAFHPGGGGGSERGHSSMKR